VVSGKRELPAAAIDSGLTKMQFTMAAIEALPALENENIKKDIDKAVLMTGVGVAGPAVVGGALLLMYKVALALFVGLGPLFILSLLFEQTKSMFSRWLFYGIGTMFSMAVLSFMVSISMKIVGAVAAQTAAKYASALALSNWFGIETEMPSISSLAMQQGGLGLVLTVLLVTIPPMAASFFQGALGQFGAYSAFGAVGRGQDGSAQQPGARPGAGNGGGSSHANQSDRRGDSEGGDGTRLPQQLTGNYGYAQSQNAQSQSKTDSVKKALTVDGENSGSITPGRPDRSDSKSDAKNS
jgi:type IV secretion system protein VirB6